MKLKIEIWPPSKIRYAYLQNNYFSGAGNLGKSCMRLKSMQKALNFYIKNNIRIVVIVDNDNKIHARALLWDNVKSVKLKKPFTYLDRVYANSDMLLSLFYDLAEENNWKRYPTTTVNEMNKNYYKKDINVVGMCHLPFMDTFRYLYPKDNLLASSSGLGINEKSDFHTSLNEHTNHGYYPDLDPDRVREVFTNSPISKKDAIFIKRYSGYVLKENIVNIRGVYYSKHDSELLKTKHDGYALREDTVNEIITDDIIIKATAVYSAKYDGYIHKSNVVNIKDVIYHKKDVDIVCFGGEWYHISQCFINYDRGAVNEEMAKQPVFFYGNLPETWIPYANVTSRGDLIPKKHAIIAYDLAYSPMLNNIVYQEVYCTSSISLILLVTGELVLDSPENRKYLKKFNNRYYIKRTFKLSDEQVVRLPDTEQTFKLPDKNQLTLF